MVAIRQQAYRLLDALPDDKLFIVVDILQAFNRNDNFSASQETAKQPIDFSKYMGRGKKMLEE